MRQFYRTRLKWPLIILPGIPVWMVLLDAWTGGSLGLEVLWLHLETVMVGYGGTMLRGIIILWGMIAGTMTLVTAITSICVKAVSLFHKWRFRTAATA